ncbi:MAG: terminase large subunit [Rhodospirillales bacterium]|nr:terminase large subunit [Rhodospirillales bacterium]
MKALEQYIGGLTISQGRYAGQPFVLLPWQRKLIRGAFGQPRDSAFSMGRGGGKTTLVAALGAASVDVDGPLVEPRAECLVVASSFDQGTVCFRHVLAFLEPSFDEHGTGPRGRFRIQDSANRATVTDRVTGAMLRVVGSDPRRLHGAAPKLLLYDEVAQWPPERLPAMLAALKTSRGKVPASRGIWLGTRPDAPEHPFQRALDGHGVGFTLCYAARPDDPPFHRRTWKRANPGLDHLPDLDAIVRQEADDARRDPDALQMFRALRLNQGVGDVRRSVLVDADSWARVERPEPADMEGKYVLGIDLGQNAAMSGAAGFWPDSGRLEAVAAFPEHPDLRVRGLGDGVGALYQKMHQRGELIVAGSRVSDIGALLRECLTRWGVPGVIVCDRWREAELREHLVKVDFPLTALVVRGQGFRDGGEDVRTFRKAVLDGKVTPTRSLLLRAAMSEARAVGDPAGNWKLAKNTAGGRRAHARDDAAAAAVLAAAEGIRRAGKATPSGPLRAVIV